MKSRLVLVDGISGSGKGTHIPYIADFFTKHNYDPFIVREPSDFLGSFIFNYRRITSHERDPEIEALLFAADRKHLFRFALEPILTRESYVVISDRSVMSNVYQITRGVSISKILALNEFYPTPDLALIFLCEPEEALRRIEKRARETGTPVTLEEHVTRIAELKEAYESFARAVPHFNPKIVNTDGSILAVQYQLRSHLNNLLGIPMERAVFLDKDGTLVDNSGYPEKIPSDEIYFDQTAEGLRRLQDAGFKLIIVSSQPWVAQGRLTLEDVERVFKSVVAKYDEKGVKIDRFYYCPHHRSEDCMCKKPNTGLLEKAVDEFSLDTSRSFMVGNMDVDIKLGRNFGLTTCLVKTGNGSRYDEKVKPNIVTDDINSFAGTILR